MKRASPLFIAFLTVAIDLLGFGIVLPLLPLYGDHFLGDVPEQYHGLMIGLLMSSFSLMQFLFAPGWGRLSDRIGRRPVLMIGLAGSVVFYALFGYATWLHSLELLFVSRIGAGIAGATIGTAQAVIADSTTKEGRARGMALIGMAFGVGFTFGPVIGALSVGDASGGNLSVAPGFVAAGLSLIALILAAALLPETRPAGELPRRPWFNLEGWRLALGHRSIAYPLLTFFMATVAFASFEGTVARYARDQLGFTIDKMGWLFAYFGFILMLTQGFVVRRLVTRVGEVAMSIAGVLLMLAGLVAVGLALPLGMLQFEPATVAAKLDLRQVLTSPDYLYVLLTMAVAVVGFAMLTPSAQALVSRRTSALQQGEVLGVNQAASAIARILGPLIGNVLYGTKEDPRHSWPFFAGAVLLGVALLFAIAMREPDNRAG